MADITGTAVGVISLAITVFGGLINFYSAWKDQDSNIRTTYLQLENLTATLQQLQLALAKQDTDSAAAAQVNRCLEACRAGIDRLSRKLDKIRQNGPPRHGQLSSLVRSATYPFKESTLMKLRETVSELREQLNLAVNVLEAESLWDVRKSINILTDQALQHRAEVRRETTHSKRNSALDWLSDLPSTTPQKRLSGTCEWILQTDEFHAWLGSNPDKQYLWLKGNAGTGKTTLVSAILDYLKGRDNLGIRLASFFTKTGAGYPLTAHAALASWLKQLCIQAPGSAIETQLVQLYEKNGGKKYSQENIGIDQLAELLGKFISECQRCILVLDGFDELPASERRIFMDSVKKWTEDRLGFARILLASRPDHAITSTLESWPSITVNGSTNHGDIVRFINFELDSAIEDRRLLRGKVSQTTLQRIQTHLLDASDGMFLWVKMQIESICADGYSEESLLCALEELPLSLHETYNQSVNKIKGQVSKLAELAGRALLCLAFSQRPLSYEELMELVTYLDRRETNAYAAAKWSADVVLGACHNFLISDAGKFSFIHVSARQYVRRFWNRLYDSKLEGEEGANALLAQACLRYLSSCGFEDPLLREGSLAGNFLSHIPDSHSEEVEGDEEGDTESPERNEAVEALMDFILEFLRRHDSFKWIPEKWVLVEYAGTHWCKHADLAGPNFSMSEFPWVLDGDSRLFRAWYLLNKFDTGRICHAVSDSGALILESVVETSGKPQLSHIAAWSGLDNLCLSAITHQPASKRGTQNAASHQGHLALTRHLLNDPAITEGAGIFSAMMYASSRSHVEVQRALLSKIDTSTEGGQANMSDVVLILMIGACINGNVPSIELASASAYRGVGLYGKVLVETVWKTHKKVGASLADIDAWIPLVQLVLSDERAYSPFVLSCLGGNHDAIRYTLDNHLVGPAISEEITVGLLLAVARALVNDSHSQDTIRLLLKTPHKPSMGPVLSLAIFGPPDTLQMLLNSLEEYSCRLPKLVVLARRIRTLAGFAAEHGRLDALKMLHRHGGSLSRGDGFDFTALHWAVHSGKQDVVEWLLSVMPSEDVGIRSLSNETAYEMALRIGHPEVIGAFERADYMHV